MGRTMPKPRKLHPELWDKQALPTKTQFRILHHLTREGASLCFIEELEGGMYRVSVSNNEDAPGFTTRTNSALVWGGFLELDPQETDRCKKGISAYRISQTGREALVQYQLHDFLSREMPAQISVKLAELRRALDVT